LRYLLISGITNPDGLCSSVMEEVLKGATDGGAQAEMLTVEGVGMCKNCKDGWGSCKSEHCCAFAKDGFGSLHEAIKDADGLCIALPPDSGKTPGSVSGFLDRLRNCENGQFGQLTNKPVLVLTFPVKTDNLLTGLEIMDRFCRQTGAIIFDFLSVQSWNSDYARASAYAAGKVMAFGRKVGVTAAR